MRRASHLPLVTRVRQPYTAYYVTLMLVTILQLCPIWFTAYPPMHDYPNHLARAHILYHYDQFDSYQATYERDWHLVPNLAIDVIVPLLLHVVSIETASKIFLSLMLILFNLGLHLLGTAVAGQPHWSALAATFFTFNYAVAYGFVNYVFGLGLFFITLAVWMRARSAWTMGRVVSLVLLTAMCYFSHLSAFVFLAITVTGLTILDMAKTRVIGWQHGLGILPLIPVTVIYLLYSAGIQHRAPLVWLQPVLTTKLTGFLYPFASYNVPVELALSTVFGAIMAIGLCWRFTRARYHEDPLILGALLVGLYLIAPFSAAESHYVDRRFIIPAAVLGVLAVKLNPAKLIGRYLVIVLVLLSFGRAAVIWHSWTHISRDIETQVQVLDLLPHEPRVYPMLMVEGQGRTDWLSDMHSYFAFHYATIYRHAFLPTIYAWKSVNPIHLRSTEPDETRMSPDVPDERIDWRRILATYDYVWGYRLSDRFRSKLMEHAHLVGQAGKASLYKLRRPFP